MAEKRMFPRRAHRVRVQYTVEGERPRVAFTSDVGPSGMFVLCPTAAPIGRPVNLEIDLGNGEALSLDGYVVWGKRVPPHLIRRARGGFGVRLHEPPVSWMQFAAA